MQRVLCKRYIGEVKDTHNLQRKKKCVGRKLIMCVKQIRASLADASRIIYDVLKAIFKVFLCIMYIWLNACMNLVSCASASESEHKGSV